MRKNLYWTITESYTHTRFKEHINIKKSHSLSAVAQHIIDTNHSIEATCLKLVKEIRDNRRLDAAESLQILKYTRDSLINTDTGPIHSILFKIHNL